MTAEAEKIEVDIVESALAHAEGFNRVLASLCAERKFIASATPPPLESTRAFIGKMIEKNNPSFLAVHEGKVVGWCDISRGKGGEGGMHNHVGLLGMGLQADYRGRGIGRKLLEITLETARERGFLRIELLTLEQNASAIALYEKFDFRFEGIKQKSHLIEGKYENGFMMALLLA